MGIILDVAMLYYHYSITIKKSTTMSKQNYGTMCRNIIANLQDRKVLPSTVEYRSGKGLIKLTGTDGRYSVIIFGTAKEIHFFLEGLQYAEVLNFATNKEA